MSQHQPPPGAYGRQPQQQPQPYGQPQCGQPGMPSGGGSSGRTLGIAVGALLVAGAAPAKKYKLTAPAMVADGYVQDSSSTADLLEAEDVAAMERFGLKNPESVDQAYVDGEGVEEKQLQFAGAWGEMEDPEAVLDATFAMIAAEMARDPGTADGNTTELVGNPEEYDPAGFANGVMKCQSIDVTAAPDDDTGLDEFSMSLCMWADHSTLGWVIPTDISAILSGTDVSPADAAETTYQVREDTRVEIS